MREIEAKILEIDPEEIIPRIEARGGQKSFEGEVRALYFDFPDGRLGAEQAVLRLRSLGEECELTLKRVVSAAGAKESIETEIRPESFEAAKRLLEGLGLVQIREAKKHRIRFDRAAFRYELDTYDGLPPLLEVEAPSTEELRSEVAALGLDPERLLAWNAFQVLDHYEGMGTER